MARVHWTLEGDGPPLVLLHAGGLDSRMFGCDMAELRELAAVLRYDRSGSGRSPAAPGPVNRVEELRTVIGDAFGGPPVVLVGSSYGGQLAIDFALTHPALAAGMVLIGPGLSGYRESDRKRARLAGLAAAACEGVTALADLWMNDPHLCPHGFPPQIERQVRAMLRDNAGRFASPSASIGLEAARGRLGELAVRGEIYVGENDDGDNRAIAEILSDVAEGVLTLHVVSDAGHFPMLESVGWLPQICAAFLAARDDHG